MKAKKHIETYIKGEYEFIRNHIIDIKNVTWKELEDIFMDSSDFEDPEEAYIHGIAIDFNDDVAWFDINSFLAWIENKIEEQKKEDPEDRFYDNDKLKNMFDRLEKYDGYIVYPSETKK